MLTVLEYCRTIESVICTVKVLRITVYVGVELPARKVREEVIADSTPYSLLHCIQGVLGACEMAREAEQMRGYEEQRTVFEMWTLRRMARSIIII